MNPMTLTPQSSLNEKSFIVFIYEPYHEIIFSRAIPNSDKYIFNL